LGLEIMWSRQQKWSVNVVSNYVLCLQNAMFIKILKNVLDLIVVGACEIKYPLLKGLACRF